MTNKMTNAPTEKDKN